MSHRVEPRLDPRVRLCMRIEITPRWKDGRSVAMETIDLSASGAACRGPIHLPLKTQVGVVLRLPAMPGEPSRDIRCEAVVVNAEEVGRDRAEWRVGLYFMSVRAEDGEALRRFVFRAMDAWSDIERAGAGRR